MCGITGFILKENKNFREIESNINEMVEKLVHRGPDHGNIWIHNNLKVALGHRRLSILDKSKAGHQPKISKSKRYVVVFNGEIYNHLELRKELNQKDTNLIWEGHSDTETLLQAFDVWGIDKTLEIISGMFAFALWDNKLEKLFLARDRMGEKPLYFGWVDKNFVFASELKSIRKFMGFKKKINLNSLSIFMKTSFVPAPYSIFENIFKLNPGTILTIHKDFEYENLTSGNLNSYKSKHLEIKKWWSFSNVKFNSKQNMLNSSNEAIAAMHSKLKKAVKSQLISDVPVGAFLSGGIDSSLIVALMQGQTSSKINTFSVGFEDNNYNEAIWAKKISKVIGTNHNELMLSSKKSLDLIEKLPMMYDEPFADSSQIPTFFVCQFAKNNVSVALSGDGGDELFGGYNRYIWLKKIWNKVGWIPMPARKVICKLISSMPHQSWNSIEKLINLFRANENKLMQLTNKIGKFSKNFQNSSNILEFYSNLNSEKFTSDKLVLNSRDEINYPEFDLGNYSLDNLEDFMMFNDATNFLPNDILCKVDRAAMSVSLETRMPMLDKDVVELSAKLPVDLKVRKNTGKWILKEILKNYIPNNLIKTSKMGFAVPLADWLRTDLRDWAESLLNEKKLKEDSYLDPKIVRKRWHEHLSYKKDNEKFLWNVLIFQMWNNQF